MRPDRGNLQVQQPRELAKELIASENSSDQRIGRDAGQLLNLEEGRWSGRFGVMGCCRDADSRSRGFVCQMQTRGYICHNAKEGPSLHDLWLFILMVPPFYPGAQPYAHFLPETTPFACHVVHRDFLPDLSLVPVELHDYLRKGHGYACYADAWKTDPKTHNLARVVHQLSLIVSMAVMRGERNSLNKVAFEFAQRLQGEARLPVGEPLPFPVFLPGDATASGATAGNDRDPLESEDMEFI